MSVRVLLVDDHPTILSGLRADLSSPEFQIVGEAGTGEEALRLIQELVPDVVILDLGLPDIGGMEVIRRLKTAGLPTRVLILSVHRSPGTIRAAMRAGASGYVTKDSSPDEIAHGIRRILAGEQFFGQSALLEIQKDFCRSRSRSKEDGRHLITKRETAIIQDLAHNRLLKEIAKRRCISLTTVKTHISNAKKKTGNSTLSGLVRFAVEQGLVKKRGSPGL
jgi:DNA-binding NarL/FixJ family response regulator